MFDWQRMIREFVILFVVIDPIGSLPVFLYVAQNVPRRRDARRGDPDRLPAQFRR